MRVFIFRSVVYRVRVWGRLCLFFLVIVGVFGGLGFGVFFLVEGREGKGVFGVRVW